MLFCLLISDRRETIYFTMQTDLIKGLRFKSCLCLIMDWWFLVLFENEHWFNLCNFPTDNVWFAVYYCSCYFRYYLRTFEDRNLCRVQLMDLIWHNCFSCSERCVIFFLAVFPDCAIELFHVWCFSLWWLKFSYYHFIFKVLRQASEKDDIGFLRLILSQELWLLSNRTLHSYNWQVFSKFHDFSY